MIIKISNIIPPDQKSTNLSANLSDPVTVSINEDGMYELIDGFDIYNRAKTEGRLTVFAKEAQITSIQDKTKAKLYRQTHKTELDIKAKKRKNKQKAGIISKKKRIGTAAGGYTFVDMGTTPKTITLDSSMQPVAYSPMSKFPTIKLGSDTYFYASQTEMEELREGMTVYKNPVAALMLAVNWSNDDLENPPPPLGLPMYLSFVDKYHEPSDHPLFLYTVEGASVKEALSDYAMVLKKKAKLEFKSSYPSWKNILSSEEALVNL